MLNMIDTQDKLKNFSEAQLIGEMQQPSGSAPQFMVLGEIDRRKRMRQDATRQEGLMQPTVAQEAISGAGVPQQGIAGLAQSLAPKTDMTQNTGVPNVQAANLPAQPNQPQKMARGGIMRLALGGGMSGGTLAAIANLKVVRPDLYEEYKDNPEMLELTAEFFLTSAKDSEMTGLESLAAERAASVSAAKDFVARWPGDTPFQQAQVAKDKGNGEVEPEVSSGYIPTNIGPTELNTPTMRNALATDSGAGFATALRNSAVEAQTSVDELEPFEFSEVTGISRDGRTNAEILAEGQAMINARRTPESDAILAEVNTPYQPDFLIQQPPVDYSSPEALAQRTAEAEIQNQARLAEAAGIDARADRMIEINQIPERGIASIEGPFSNIPRFNPNSLQSAVDRDRELSGARKARNAEQNRRRATDAGQEANAAIEADQDNVLSFLRGEYGGARGLIDGLEGFRTDGEVVEINRDKYEDLTKVPYSTYGTTSDRVIDDNLGAYESLYFPEGSTDANYSDKMQSIAALNRRAQKYMQSDLYTPPEEIYDLSPQGRLKYENAPEEEFTTGTGGSIASLENPQIAPAMGAQADIDRLNATINDPKLPPAVRAKAAQDLKALQNSIAVNQYGGNLSATVNGIDIPEGYMIGPFGLIADPNYRSPGKTGDSLVDQAAMGGGEALNTLAESGAVDPTLVKTARTIAEQADYERSIYPINEEIAQLTAALENPYVPADLKSGMETRIAKLKKEIPVVASNAGVAGDSLIDQAASSDIGTGYKGLIDPATGSTGLASYVAPEGSASSGDDLPQALKNVRTDAAFLSPKTTPVVKGGGTSGGTSVRTGGGTSAGSGQGRIADLIASRKKEADQNKWLALAQAGMNLMSTGDFGQAGQEGIKALLAQRESMNKFDTDMIKMESDLVLNNARLEAARRSGVTKPKAVPAAYLTDLRKQMEAKQEQLARLKPAEAGGIFSKATDPDAALRIQLEKELQSIQGQIDFMYSSRGLPTVSGDGRTKV